MRNLPAGLLVIVVACAAGPAAYADNQAVNVNDNVFTPSRVAVKPGEKVIWDNPASGNPHNVRFEDGLFISPPFPSVGPWSTERTFGADGSYRYFCEFHGIAMTGAVYVNSLGLLPPSASFLPLSSVAQAGESVGFNAGTSGATSPATITSFKWDLDGNGSLETDTGTTATTSRLYPTPGTVRVKLQVTDSNGLTAEQTRSVRINSPPSASFTVTPNPARVGQTVSFTGSFAGDSDGSIARFEWDLDGNGSFETNTGFTATTSRSYSTAQAPTVRLRVTDNDNAKGETTRSLRINALATFGPPPPTLADVTKPVLSAVSVSPSRFRAAAGSAVSYTVSEAAAVRFRVERALPGRRARGRCRKPARSNRGGRRCTRYRTLAGSLRHQGRAGSNRFTFRGRLAGRALRAGRYRLLGVATDARGNVSAPRRGRFRIARR